MLLCPFLLSNCLANVAYITARRVCRVSVIAVPRMQDRKHAIEAAIVRIMK
jgi:hypothetical protein